MLTAPEITRSLAAAHQLFFGKAEGMDGLDTSADGFFRSFLAFFLLLPLMAVELSAERAILIHDGIMQAETFPDVAFYGMRFASALVIWLGFAVLMLPVARMLDAGGRYSAFMVAHNWTNVYASLISVVPSLFIALDIMNPQPLRLIALLILLVTVRYMWFTARTALGISAVMAAAVVIIEILFIYLVVEAGSRLAGIG